MILRFLNFLLSIFFFLFFGAYMTVLAWGPIILIGMLVDMKPIEAGIIVGIFSLFGGAIIFAAK